MKTIGLIGGMSWESTQGYYRAINEGIKRRLGGLHSAQLALYSVDFEPIEKLQHAAAWTRRPASARMAAVPSQSSACCSFSMGSKSTL